MATLDSPGASGGGPSRGRREPLVVAAALRFEPRDRTHSDRTEASVLQGDQARAHYERNWLEQAPPEGASEQATEGRGRSRTVPPSLAKRTSLDRTLRRSHSGGLATYPCATSHSCGVGNCWAATA